MKGYSNKNNHKKIKSYNTFHKNIKDSEIKIRVSKEQKKELQRKAKECGMTLSSYMLTPHTKNMIELLRLIPQTVELWDALNGLYQSVEAAASARLTEFELQNNALNTYIQKNNQYSGGFCDDKNN